MIDDKTRQLCKESLLATIAAIEAYLKKNPISAVVKEKKGLEAADRSAFWDERVQNHKASTQQLQDCEAALNRMNEGTWELCVQCGHPIAEDRRVARPEASRCKTCQEKKGLRVR